MRKVLLGLALLTLVPVSGRAIVTPTWDVFVDGQRYHTTAGVGDNLTGPKVVAEVLPLTDQTGAIQIHVVIDSILGGTHRVGIGFGGANVGVDFEAAVPATPIDLVVQFGNLTYQDLITHTPPSSCTSGGSIAVKLNGANHVTAIVSSVGSTFTDADQVFLRLASIVDTPTFSFTTDACSGGFSFDTGPLSDFSSMYMSTLGFVVDISKVPEKLHIGTQAIPDWTFGIVFLSPGGMDIAVKMNGVQLLSANGLQRFSLMTRSSPNPILRIGVGLRDPGNVATFGSGFFTITATKQPDTTLVFNNGILFGSVTVAEGDCATVVLDILAECNLGDSSI